MRPTMFLVFNKPAGQMPAFDNQLLCRTMHGGIWSYVVMSLADWGEQGIRWLDETGRSRTPPEEWAYLGPL